MKNKKILSIILAISMVGSLLAGCGSSDSKEVASKKSAESAKSSTASIEEEEEGLSREDVLAGKRFVAPEKSETVTVKADASGNVTKISSEVTLSGFDQSDGDFVKDKSNLTEVKNKKGAEEYFQKKGKIYWQNLGETIKYEGESDKELPMTVDVSYYLNGTEMTPDQIAGQSGNFEIKFEFNNKLDGDYVPFTAVPAVMMSDSDFSDLDVNKGKVVSMGDNQVVIGYCTPGLQKYLNLSSYDLLDDEDIDMPDYIVITGHTDDFKLDMTAVIIKNGLFSELEDDDLDDFDDLADGLDDLGDAGDKLQSAAGKLVSGTSKFQDYLEQYVDGVDSLAEGIDTLDKSMEDIDTETMLSQIQDQMAAEQAEIEAAGGTYDPEQSQYAQMLALVQGMAQVKDGVSQLNEGADQLSSAGSKLVKGYKSMKSGISQFSSAIRKLNKKGLKKMANKGDDVESILKKVRTLKKNDLTYDNYSGKAKNQDTDVTFIIECDGVEED